MLLLQVMFKYFDYKHIIITWKVNLIFLLQSTVSVFFKTFNLKKHTFEQGVCRDL